MADWAWRPLAWVLARPRVSAWIIERATRTPYTHLGKPGNRYMHRYWLFNPCGADNTPARWPRLPSVRVHCILRPDRHEDLHSHPWRKARTFLLFGARYDEERAGDNMNQGDTYRQIVHPNGTLEYREVFHRQAGDTVALGRDVFHRISRIDTSDPLAPNAAWTLFVTWGPPQGWFFKVDGANVPSRQYLDTHQ